MLSHRRSWDTIAASTSTKDVHCFSLTEGGLVRRPLDTTASGHHQSSDICGVRFANGDANLLYVGTYDGTIYTYDLRTMAAVSQYRDADPTAAGGSNHQDAAAAVRKPLLCIDVNANDRVLCAGTERVGCDAYLLFFDTRSQRPMGGYWESHSDDVSQVRFHPTRPDRLASGSTDGLINVYDIGQATEDDALELCMNTESSVAQLQWHTAAPASIDDSDGGRGAAASQADRDLLSCITHVNDLHLYDADEQEQVYAQDRAAMAGHVRRSAPSECHVVGVHSTAQPGSLFVLAGSNYNRGECLRSLTLSGVTTAEPKQPQQKPATITVQPGVMFEQNKQVVRCSLFNANVSVKVGAMVDACPLLNCDRLLVHASRYIRRNCC